MQFNFNTIIVLATALLAQQAAAQCLGCPQYQCPGELGVSCSPTLEYFV